MLIFLYLTARPNSTIKQHVVITFTYDDIEVFDYCSYFLLVFCFFERETSIVFLHFIEDLESLSVIIITTTVGVSPSARAPRCRLSSCSLAPLETHTLRRDVVRVSPCLTSTLVGLVCFFSPQIFVSRAFKNSKKCWSGCLKKLTNKRKSPILTQVIEWVLVLLTQIEGEVLFSHEFLREHLLNSSDEIWNILSYFPAVVTDFTLVRFTKSPSVNLLIKKYRSSWNFNKNAGFSAEKIKT